MPDPKAGIEHAIIDPQWDLIGLLIQHLVLLSLLFTIPIIRSEKLPVPLSLWLIAVALAIVSLFDPRLPGIVDWKFGAAQWLEFGRESFKALGLGLVAAAVAAGIVSITKLENLRPSFLAFSVVGLFISVVGNSKLRFRSGLARAVA